MKFKAYTQSVVPIERQIILGLTLKPLSLGHYLLGNRFGVGYFSDTATSVSWADLIVGVLICSMDYQDFLDFIDEKPEPREYLYGLLKLKIKPNFQKEVARWSKKIQKRIKKDKLFNIFKTEERFKQYIKQGSEMPGYKLTEMALKNQSPSGSPWALNVMTVCIGKLGYSRSEVLNSPLVQVLAEYAKYLESEGAIEMHTDSYEDYLDTINKLGIN